MHTQGNYEIEILKHNISYYYDNDQEMPESDQSHVEEMIIDGYSSGELVDSDDNRGWWKIDNLSPEQKAAPLLLAALKDLMSQLEAVGVAIKGEDEGQWVELEGLSFDNAYAAIAEAE